jgi:hypothetical protein
VECKAEGGLVLRKSGPNDWRIDTGNLQQALSDETERARRWAVSDSENLRTSSTSNERLKVMRDDLKNEASYTAFLKSLRNPVEPDWRWEIDTEVWGYEGDAYTLSVQLVNVSPSQKSDTEVGGGKSNARARENVNVEPFLFDTRASFALRNGELLSFEIDLAPKGFRYDRYMWGRGFNCALEASSTASVGSNAKPDFLRTTHTPLHEQMRYRTRSAPPARFDKLTEDPDQVLGEILEAMERYLDEWDKARQRYVEHDPAWEGKHGAEFDSDKRTFEEEITRFCQGCDLIRDDLDVRKAFCLTNETFKRTGDNTDPERRKDSWRLFQIVFLVSQVPDMAALKNPSNERVPSDVTDREQVDIVYFPTGGGKTEAYLGTMVFHCFFDRLRGKSAGVTAWIRFPLRLLTLQQTQRAADVVGMAEIVREEQTDPRLTGAGVAGFAVGYFVGKSSTPNELYDPDKVRSAKPVDTRNWSFAHDPQERDSRWRRLIRCPACREKSVELCFDEDKVRVIHRCTTEGCSFAHPKRIPVYVVDNEVYRHLPSIMVGTIDKLAGIGNQRKLSLVFGDVDGKCRKHGYYKGKCCQKDCWDRNLLEAGAPKGMSGPTLFVQDELHLLKEGLGTFDGHYETFVQEMKRQRGEKAPLKIIASSATIEAFERQAEHLYGRGNGRSRVFPGPGPTLDQSFYAQTMKHPQRMFVGLIPHNKTILNAALELIEFYHREVQSLAALGVDELNPYGGSYEPGTDDWRELLDPYFTSLTYFTDGKVLNSIRTDLESEVNRNLKSDKLKQLEVLELTGAIGTDEVTQTLERLERPANGSEGDSDAVLATNMISHGVDIDRLNSMIFYGMPHQTAEYIQASSRVGRAHVGVVFSCLHPVRERDQSHYGYFGKYHEYMGQMVEPVAINRWAKRSIDRTLPGLFMGVLLQLLAYKDPANINRYYVKEFVQQKISTGEITSEHFIPILEKAYGVEDNPSAGALEFRKRIREKVGFFLDHIQGQSYDSDWVSDALRPYKPMTSLRDVDDPVDIELDTVGSYWADVAAKQGRGDGN